MPIDLTPKYLLDEQKLIDAIADAIHPHVPHHGYAMNEIAQAAIRAFRQEIRDQVPERSDRGTASNYDVGNARGFNECLNLITGEEK